MKVQNKNLFDYKITKNPKKRVPDMSISMSYNEYDDGKLPVNLTGSMNRANFLIALFSHYKIDRSEQIKAFAKKARLVDIHYFPQVHYSLEKTEYLEEKMYWHINIIFNSLIVNFYNTQEILTHFLPDHPKAKLTIKDIKHNLQYWTAKIINEKLAKYYIKKYLNIVSKLNNYTINELLERRIEVLTTKTYDNEMNVVPVYKSANQIISLCETYNPHFQPAYNSLAKFNIENLITGYDFTKKLSIRVYRSKRIQLFI